MTTSAYIMLIGGITFFLFAVACGEAYAARLAKLEVRGPFWNWPTVYRTLWAASSPRDDALAARRHFWQMLFCIGGLVGSLLVGVALR
jgi:hypothetical protein